MTQHPDMADLTGRVLIAMPGMTDPRFHGSVVYLCAHSDDGALGLIVNRPSPELRFKDLLGQLGIELSTGGRDIAVRFGGPVEHGRGFVLHSAEYAARPSTLKVDDRIALTATLDVLEAIARGDGPSQAMLALGYAGWGPGQVEAEIAANGWLVGDATDAIVFGEDDSRKWSAALKDLGIDALTLSGTAGRA